MHRYFTTTVLCAGLLAHAVAEAYAQSGSPSSVFNFNPGWKLWVGDSTNAAQPGFDDAAWKTVTLPHAWNEDSAVRKPPLPRSTARRL